MVIYEQMLKRTRWLLIGKELQHGLYYLWILNFNSSILSEIQTIDKCDKANVSTPWSPVSGPDKRYNDKIWNVNDDPRGTISPRQSRGSLGPPPPHKQCRGCRPTAVPRAAFQCQTRFYYWQQSINFCAAPLATSVGTISLAQPAEESRSVCCKYLNLRMMWLQHNELLYISSHTG